MSEPLTLSEIRSAGRLEVKIKLLPPWAREYIEELEYTAETAQDAEDAAQATLNFERALAANWAAVASARWARGDADGARRAQRAAELMRS